MKNKKNYCQSFSHSVTESVSELIISFKEASYKENEEEIGNANFLIKSWATQESKSFTIDATQFRLFYY